MRTGPDCFLSDIVTDSAADSSEKMPSMVRAPSSMTGRSWWRWIRSVTAGPLCPTSRDTHLDRCPSVRQRRHEAVAQLSRRPIPGVELGGLDDASERPPEVVRVECGTDPGGENRLASTQSAPASFFALTCRSHCSLSTSTHRSGQSKRAQTASPTLSAPTGTTVDPPELTSGHRTCPQGFRCPTLVMRTPAQYPSGFCPPS
ncbi:hypothetical protein LV75_000397 [Actinokineospora diospyrosa]|uniref:Uncharacterized protein n=1 Tax=Actinokineospora diospyrosa TaxID=103728 RepID=A0ABT1I5L1_9PSEU|nr:hypothetical protein [Actinokineospora diospyrosa]